VKSGRARAEAAIAVLFSIVMLAVGGGALWFMSVTAVHEDAAVPSTAAVSSDGYAGAVEESRRLARALVAPDNLPGLSVAVAVNGEIAWAEGFGWADGDRTPLTPLTRFRLGALSKPLTAVAAALLHDRGRLDLDAPVQRYVPAYPEKQWTVTTRQLMGDVAGIHRIRGDNNDAMPVEHCTGLDEAVALFAGDPLMFEPGTEHRYSIYGWVLVSAAIEGAAAEPFSQFMVRQVFEPLAMERTVVAETEGVDGVTALSQRSVLGIRLKAVASRRPDYSCLAGAGAFLSTPTDLVRLGSAMLKPGLLKAETIAAFQTPTRLASGASTTYALGWTVSSVPLAGERVRMVSHRGSPLGGYVSLLTFPELGLAIAAAANVNASTVHPFAQQVADAFARQKR
jgi:CubicO group peptidase (beta-lactamase class C family)